MLNETNPEDFSSDIIRNQLHQYFKKHPTNAISLQPLTRILFQVTFGYCVDQLLILKYNCNEVVENEEELYEYVSLKERFEVTDEVKQQLLEEKYERITHSDMHKLQKDICFLTNTLIITCLEMSDTGYFTFLMKVIMGIAQEDIECVAIDNDRKAKISQIKLLEKTLKNEKAPMVAEIKKCEDMTYDVSMKLRYCYFDLRLQAQYVNDWEDTRTAQFNYQATEKHNACLEEIKKSNVNIQQEERIHDEICSYIQENIDDLEVQIQYWLETYERDIEEIDTDLSLLKYKYDEFSGNYEQLKTVFEERAREIQDWSDLKERKLAAAIKIQTWWREVLIKKQIAAELKAEQDKEKKGKKGKKGKGKGKSKKTRK